MIPRLHAFLRKQPRALIVVAGMLWIAFLTILDYFAPLDLSFLIFYVAPVLFLVWFVGLAAGLAGAAASAAFWIWEDLYWHTDLDREPDPLAALLLPRREPPPFLRSGDYSRREPMIQCR